MSVRLWKRAAMLSLPLGSNDPQFQKTTRRFDEFGCRRSEMVRGLSVHYSRTFYINHEFKNILFKL